MSAAKSRALELAQYVADVQNEVETLTQQNSLLRSALLDNLENRYTRILRTTNSVAVMAIFAQWKIIASNCSFKKEVAESEARSQEERRGFAGHLAELEESTSVAKQNCDKIEQGVNVLRAERAELEEKIAAKRTRVEALRGALVKSSSFVDDLKQKLEGYEESSSSLGISMSGASEQPEDASSEGPSLAKEGAMLKKELHHILQKLDPAHVIPADLAGGGGGNTIVHPPGNHQERSSATSPATLSGTASVNILRNNPSALRIGRASGTTTMLGAPAAVGQHQQQQTASGTSTSTAPSPTTITGAAPAALRPTRQFSSGATRQVSASFVVPSAVVTRSASSASSRSTSKKVLAPLGTNFGIKSSSNSAASTPQEQHAMEIQVETATSSVEENTTPTTTTVNPPVIGGSRGPTGVATGVGNRMHSRARSPDFFGQNPLYNTGNNSATSATSSSSYLLQQHQNGQHAGSNILNSKTANQRSASTFNPGDRTKIQIGTTGLGLPQPLTTKFGTNFRLTNLQPSPMHPR
ncbi:unnamed protein product [Amoebophrya sp. A25]|nr:unnamed protein product [Amoebophrya sp. A25]|eukprot:GSA25T00021177001.1